MHRRVLSRQQAVTEKLGIDRINAKRLRAGAISTLGQEHGQKALADTGIESYLLTTQTDEDDTRARAAKKPKNRLIIHLDLDDDASLTMKSKTKKIVPCPPP